MNNFAILLFIGVSLHSSAGAVYQSTGTSASSGASSSSNGGGGTYTQTSGPSGTFTTSTGNGVYGPGFPYAPFVPNFFPIIPQAPYAPFLGQPAVGPGPFISIPVFDPTPLITPTDFTDALNQYLRSIQRQYATGGSYTYATPGATVSATTFLGPTNDLYQQQQQLIDQWRDAQLSYYNTNYGNKYGSNGGSYSNTGTYSGHGSYPSSGSGSYNGGSGSYSGGSTGTYVGGGVGSAATATYGPGGVHQTASLYPANPAQPNLDSRFGEDSPPTGGAGYYGVGTASFSSSSDVNGHKSHKHGAITSVNDNGKVTTYRIGD